MDSLFNSRWLLWLVLALPGAFMVTGLWRETLFYGEFIHASGETGARLLILTMAVTPLCLMFPRAAWPRWLLQRRRYLGVAAFGYVLLHAVVYVGRQADLATILDDARATAMWTGWLAFAIMLVLALTSNDRSVRALRKAWKVLHRWVYVAALLTFLHWVLSAFDPVPGAIHFGVLALLEGCRLWKTRFGRGKLIDTGGGP